MMINTKMELTAVVNPTIGFLIFFVNPSVHFSYSSIASLNLLNENTVCPNVLTTGTPRIYSTASADMTSKEF